MEENSFSQELQYKRIDQASGEILEYMDDRRKGLVKSLATRWNKLNDSIMGGLEWGTIVTIGGMSGSGKSSIANELETSLFDHNTDQTFSVLSFNFEMLAMKQVGRKISAKMQKTVSELYSSAEPLPETDFDVATEIVKKDISQYDIYYVDVPGTVEQIYNTIMKFHEQQLKLKGEKYGTVVFLDHTLLTKGRSGQQERQLLSELYRMFMFIKKKINCIVIALSQLNREIERAERLSNPMLHYPMKKDIFGSDSVFHGSDNVLISHKPYMLNLQTYGPNNLPILNPMNPKQAMLYWHLIKNREGESGLVLGMLDNLKHNRVDEYFEPGNLNFNM
tara:strand:+ start:5773 stop:6774 length:1002 start_codon:yes stop_codon:yes gene_type:complete